MKKIYIALFDAVLLTGTVFLSLYIRLGEIFFPRQEMHYLALLFALIALLTFYGFGLYNLVNRHINFHAVWLIAKAVSIASLVWSVLVFLSGYGMLVVPRSVVLISWALSILFVVGSRMFVFWLFSQETKNTKRVLVYGAGGAGFQIHNALQSTPEIKVSAFVDDAVEKQGKYIYGVKVISPEDIGSVIVKEGVSEILLTIPSASKSRRADIINKLELDYSLKVRTLPRVDDLAKGNATISDLREVSIEDLLGRDSVLPSQTLLQANTTDRVVMVTGAGGSIGSELCRQVANLGVRKLILFEQNEFSLYAIHEELAAIKGVNVVPILGSVTNQSRIEKVCETFGVQTIYHAAAYKHVPMVEFNNTEGVHNNILGTLHVAQAAVRCDVETFVLISTDKAVRPTNTMGATKRFAEMILQAFADQPGKTRFVMVRFGNVLGSSGSVIPLFKKQINNGGPLTVTHREITRYFMTIPEAVELVIQAGAMGEGGDVFVLNMGKPVKIYDLARKMVHLMGFEIRDNSNPNGDIEIEITGLRPGEKLYEELLIGNNADDTQHPLIMKAQEEMMAWHDLQLILKELELSIQECDQDKLRELLIRAVPGFKPQCKVSDILYQEK